MPEMPGPRTSICQTSCSETSRVSVPGLHSIAALENVMARKLIGQGPGFGWPMVMGSIVRAEAMAELASMLWDEACWSRWAEALGAVWGKAPGFRRRIHFQGSSSHCLQRC